MAKKAAPKAKAKATKGVSRADKKKAMRGTQAQIKKLAGVKGGEEKKKK